MTAGFACYERFFTHDDFTLETDSALEAVECWAFFDPSFSEHQPFCVSLRYDHYGMPGGYYRNLYITDVEKTYTGDNFQGKPVLHYRFNWQDPMGVEGGTPFWLEIYSEADYFNWAARDEGNLYWQWNQFDKAAFFRLLGTPEDSRIQPASWGEIKAGFSD